MAVKAVGALMFNVTHKVEEHPVVPLVNLAQ
jgi:hypothetical protein